MLRKAILMITILLFTTSVWAAEHTGTPGNTLGTINNGVYVNSITTNPAYGRFSIKIPQYNSAEYKNLPINENINADESLVSFGRTDNDLSYYRVIVSYAKPKALNDAMADNILNATMAEMSILSKNIKLLQTVKTNIGNHTGYYAVFTQVISRDTPINPKLAKSITAQDVMYKPQTFTHIMFIMQVKNIVIVFWLQGTDYKQSNLYPITANDMGIIARISYRPFNNFVNSFTLLPAK